MSQGIDVAASAAQRVEVASVLNEQCIGIVATSPSPGFSAERRGAARLRRQARRSTSAPWTARTGARGPTEQAMDGGASNHSNRQRRRRFRACRTAAATGTSIIGCRARPWGSRARIFQGSDRTWCTIVRAAARRPPGDTGGGVRARRRRGDGGTGSDACPGALPLRAAERHAVWKSTNELGCHNCGQRRVDGVEAPRHRADAVMGTTSCRWCGASEIFDLTQVARRCVLGQAETQEASATPDARPSTARGDGVPVGSRAVLRATHGAHLPNAILPLDDGVTSMTSVERRRGARTVPKSIKKPPTTSSDGHELRRWREGTAAPRDAVIMMRY